MRTFYDVSRTLRKSNWKNYLLLIGCCFFSVLLITAYVTMMRSPTVLSVLPEGGDSRKQVMMIFVLAVIGCGVFTCYAAGLFFRSKSKDTGLFLALGAPRRLLARELMEELAVIAGLGCVSGAVLGTPLAWLLWQLFRLLVVDTEEMPLTLDSAAYLFALAFALFVFVMLLLMGRRFLRRTNIIDIVNESRKTEPIRDVPRWYGPAGLGLMVLGAFLGYSMPAVFIRGLHWYPPEGLTAVFYAPLLAGLYMVLLHTVVNGWRGGRSLYQHIIATSMMKFQGRQTVRNMLVITVLLAGAYFASFYTPMLGTGAMMSYDARPVDYAYHWRADQDIPRREEVEALAEEYGVSITSWTQAPLARLGVDGNEHVEVEGRMGTTWSAEYRELLASELFLSESAYRVLTGEPLELQSGQIAGVFDAAGDGQGVFGGDAALLTNTITGKTLSVTPLEPLKNDMLFGRYVMDDGDYEAMTAGLPEDWREELVFFNVENCEDTYSFAKALFYEIVDRSGPEVEQYDAWDPVMRERRIQEEGSYSFDREHLEENGFAGIDYNQRDSSAFRMFWQYMPQFRVLDKADFVKTTAVFLMLFIFIALICFAAVLVIGYTRCLTIALTNSQVYEDLRRLGAGRDYLYRSVRGQVSRVWTAPVAVGTAAIYGFYAMIMYFNDGRLTVSELAGLGNCALLILALTAMLYGFYRLTLRKVCQLLRI